MSSSGALKELSLGSTHRGRPEVSIAWAVVRPLVDSDIPALQAGMSPGLPRQQVRELRTAHHQLAQLLARGEEQHVICLMTGYTESYLSVLKGDPAFRELVKYYTVERELVFVDLVERQKALGIATVEELQARLESEPEKWTKRELMELLDRCQGASGKAIGQGPSAPPTPAMVQVNFVSARPRPQGQVIDIEASDG